MILTGARRRVMAFQLFIESKRKHLSPSWLLSLLCLHAKTPSHAAMPQHAKKYLHTDLFHNHHKEDQQPLFEGGRVEVFFLAYLDERYCPECY